MKFEQDLWSEEKMDEIADRTRSAYSYKLENISTHWIDNCLPQRNSFNENVHFHDDRLRKVLTPSQTETMNVHMCRLMANSPNSVTCNLLYSIFLLIWYFHIENYFSLDVHEAIRHLLNIVRTSRFKQYHEVLLLRVCHPLIPCRIAHTYILC